MGVGGHFLEEPTNLGIMKNSFGEMNFNTNPQTITQSGELVTPLGIPLYIMIDSMSAFGAIDLKPSEIRYEALVSSANKCIEGVPGFSFVICRRSSLLAAEGCAATSGCLHADPEAHTEAQTGKHRLWELAGDPPRRG